MEIIDIFDESYNLIGTCEKEEAHKKGLWHHVFACLLINSKNNKVYLQYKDASHNPVDKKNKIDISVGGHLKSGEQLKDGTREIKEETGLKVDYKDLVYVGLRKINKTINANYIIREFDHLYIYDKELDIKTLKSEDDEVIYFIEFDIDELIDYLKTNKEEIIGNTPNGQKIFKREDFIKGYLEDDQLYLNYLTIAKDYKKDLKMWS